MATSSVPVIKGMIPSLFPISDSDNSNDNSFIEIWSLPCLKKVI